MVDSDSTYESTLVAVGDVGGTIVELFPLLDAVRVISIDGETGLPLVES